MNKLFFVLAFLFSLVANAQEALQPEMADKFREEGKIYIVVLIIVIILSGLFFYLVSLDKKITNLEKQVTKDKE
jgi:heme/copper-type cytochrome/quinol oxidase subunit 2